MGWGARVESVISVLSPQWAARRKLWREYGEESSFSSDPYRNANSTRISGAAPARSTSADFSLESQDSRINMVDRARELERNNPIADGILSRSVENVVSNGIKPQAKTSDPEWNKLAEELWEQEFVPNADVRGFDDFYGLQALVQRSLVRDGDIGAIKLGNGQLQLVESDQIAAPHGKRFTANHVDGIDTDKRGKPITFYIVEQNTPQQITQNRRDHAPRKKVSAENMIFMALRKRAGQTRGVTRFATIFHYFHQTERLIHAVITAARMAACVGLFIKSNFPPGVPNTTTDSDGKNRDKWHLEPAMVKYLERGEEIGQLTPHQPGTNFDDFLSSLFRLIGLPFGQPLELMMMDYSRTNYSSARAALLQAYRAFRIDQNRLVKSFCRPCYLWQVERWIEDGKLPFREDWKKHIWVPPGWTWIDPLKEIQADMMAVDAGFKSLSDVAMSQGRDWLEILEQRGLEVGERDRLMLSDIRSSNTRDPFDNTNNAPQNEKPKAEPDPDDDDDKGDESEDNKDE